MVGGSRKGTSKALGPPQSALRGESPAGHMLGNPIRCLGVGIRRARRMRQPGPGAVCLGRPKVE